MIHQIRIDRGAPRGHERPEIGATSALTHLAARSLSERTAVTQRWRQEPVFLLRSGHRRFDCANGDVGAADGTIIPSCAAVRLRQNAGKDRPATGCG
jgi:hypothetical protein